MSYVKFFRMTTVNGCFCYEYTSHLSFIVTMRVLSISSYNFVGCNRSSSKKFVKVRGKTPGDEVLLKLQAGTLQLS